MSDKRLLPCPFCGGEATMTHYSNKFSTWYQVVCMNCHVSQTSTFLSEEVATAEWNTRKPMERIAERLEEELVLSDKEKLRCINEDALQFDIAKGYATGIYNAIEIVKEDLEEEK